MQFNLISKIEELSNSDGSAENRKIALFLIENYHNIKNLSITFIAKHCQTSPTKITRFAEKLGLSGFSELKLRLFDLSNSILIDGTLVDVKNDIIHNDEAFFEKYFEIHQKSFENQFEYFKTKSLSKVLNLLSTSKKIYLFAFNLSYNISKNFVQRLRWFDINIISESDYISIETYINIIKENDLVMLITISGSNSLIENIAKKLSKKTNLIGIGGSNCQFKNLFDDFIQFDTNESQLWNINSIKSQLVIQLLDFIYVKWVIKNNKDLNVKK